MDLVSRVCKTPHWRNKCNTITLILKMYVYLYVNKKHCHAEQCNNLL